MKKDKLPGGRGDNRPDSDFDPSQLKAGIEHELEHTGDRDLAKEIAKDHLVEDPSYYTKLKKIEKSAFWSGFDKQAGLDKQAGPLLRGYNRLKGLVTGKKYLYHGTSKARASLIRKMGLKPNQVGGVSERVLAGNTGKTLKDVNKNLVFTSRERNIAKNYANNQAQLDVLKKKTKDNPLAGMFAGFDPDVRKAKGDVVRFDIPKKDYNRMHKVKNPEWKYVDDNVRRSIDQGTPAFIANAQGRAQKKMMKHDKVFKNSEGISAKYVGKPGVDEKVINAVDNPLGYAAMGTVGLAGVHTLANKDKKKGAGSSTKNMQKKAAGGTLGKAVDLAGLGMLAAPSIQHLRGKPMKESTTHKMELAGLGTLAAPYAYDVAKDVGKKAWRTFRKFKH